jgi:predicted nucleotide-binding protein (sugar kinase/HSP70/actin superfamily)
MWDCFLLSDILHKVELSVRPYEREVGSADRAVSAAVSALSAEFERGGKGLPTVLGEELPKITALRHKTAERPRVGVVGEIYVRNAPFINNYLFKTIEKLGGEVHCSSLAEWVLYTDYLKRHGIGAHQRTIGDRIAAPMREHFLSARERLYHNVAEPYLDGRVEPELEDIVKVGEPYVPLDFQGEAILTIGRAIMMIKEEGIDMVVNASPTFCMPGTITSAIFPKIEQELGAPIVSIFYDGSGDPNRVLVPHLHYLVDRITAVGSGR